MRLEEGYVSLNLQRQTCIFGKQNPPWISACVLIGISFYSFFSDEKTEKVVLNFIDKIQDLCLNGSQVSRELEAVASEEATCM